MTYVHHLSSLAFVYYLILSSLTDDIPGVAGITADDVSNQVRDSLAIQRVAKKYRVTNFYAELLLLVMIELYIYKLCS